MEKLDMFRFKFGKIDKFVWLDLEVISADVVRQFDSTEFQDSCQTCGVNLTLAATERQ